MKPESLKKMVFGSDLEDMLNEKRKSMNDAIRKKAFEVMQSKREANRE